MSNDLEKILGFLKLLSPKSLFETKMIEFAFAAEKEICKIKSELEIANDSLTRLYKGGED